ncbi:hypothetical protein Back11_42940 [Paenibacillus baekrokdamisoli]|uniref:Uncharacterized protein n=1 Tax=Paenibacillus baekrokdamisoli TaxID=1712516 RepID=A0A3G9JIU2_9BACL|nr:ChbG/HpnK family deacetylase [Paenibacillus baekrokdamisoli]MBB3068003.1 hypothetical protein [Paenibacillus baekrokdamisoli]BBH22949.1 hypothetical protein Back11_42940 [Paenibacillus baekrokdamisoli]
MTKYLIINADDFGLSDRVNQGILKAHKFGTVSSTSLMVNMPGYEHAILAAKQTPSLGVGLHFNLTSGKPLSPAAAIPSLLRKDGCFSGERHSWKEEEVEIELNHQYNKIVSTKVIPTHLDSHHHIHIEVPSVYNVMKKFAILHALPLRLNPFASDPIDHALRTDYLIMDTYDTEDGIVRLLTHIQTLQEGTTEIMCHPQDSENETKGAELLALTNPLIKEAIQMHAIQLIHFRQLIHFGQLPKIEPLLEFEPLLEPLLELEPPQPSSPIPSHSKRRIPSRKRRILKTRKKIVTLKKTRIRKKKHLSPLSKTKKRKPRGY